MKIPRLPFHNVVAELLYSLIIGGECIGYQELYVYYPYTTVLNVPDGAVYALIICEADINASDKTKVIRFKQVDTAGNPPSPYTGMPLGDLGVLEVKGRKNLSSFMAAGIRPGEYHLLRIEYYS